MSTLENVDDNAYFTIANIPFGIVSLKDNPDVRLVATRVHGDIYIIPGLIKHGLLTGLSKDVQGSLYESTLNTFISFPRSICNQVRIAIQELLKSFPLPSNSTLAACKYAKSAVITHVPVTIGDFTDFSCSMNHVLNASEAMTGKRSMPPCFPHFPPGYSGRCSSIVPSGTRIQRPQGQYKDGSGEVVYGPSGKIDFELEIGAIVGQPTKLGCPVHIDEANQHIFGLVLLNDWSARDIQAFEMSPLGPLNGKSFGTTVSPWIITLDALQPYLCTGPPVHDSKVQVAPYLQSTNARRHFNITTQAHIVVDKASTSICTSNFRDLYWSLEAMVVHQTSNGCKLNAGDMLGTGTISGPEPGTYGCLLEMTHGGKSQIQLNDGSSRTYLHDGDGVRLTAWAGELGTASCVGFGECFGVLEPALDV